MSHNASGAPSGKAAQGGYSKSRLTKQAIVESAAKAFAKSGFYGASLRHIAREAGIDHGTLLYHFRDKTSLLLAVIDWSDGQAMPTEWPRAITAEELADGFTAQATRNLETPGIVQLLSLLTAEAGAEGHPARERLQSRHETLTALITAAIEEQRAALGLTDDFLAPAQRAALILATWEGMQVYDALHPGVLDVPDLVGRMFRDAFGLTPPPSG